MRWMKLIAPAAVLTGGFLVCTSSVYGTAEYAKKEKKACTYCHTKMVAEKTEMAKNLNDAGNCYKSNEHSLAKCAPPAK